ncbi:MAG: adenine phosphoribosyltransferase [Thermoplasmata archaeon]|nr:MAG: adenine phosphoribosyltransferase [Thermoplasmata archaeon]
MSINVLKKSFENVPIVKKGDYDYVIHPITDGVPYIEPGLLGEVVQEIKKRVETVLPFDKIVTIEAMGIPIASVLSMEMKIPFTIIRKRSYSLPGEVIVKQETGYSKSNLYINGLSRGDKVVIVDDVLSTGGTLRAVLSSLKQMGVIVKGVFIAVSKGGDVSKEIEKEFNISIDTVIGIDVVNGRVVVKNI